MKKFILFLLVVMLVLVVILRVRYGGGEPYRDLSTSPLMLLLRGRLVHLNSHGKPLPELWQFEG